MATKDETAPEKTISKMEGVRRALAELGADAQPIDIKNHLMEKFKIDMTTAHISNYKTSLARGKSSKKGRPVGRPKGSKSANKNTAESSAISQQAPVKMASNNGTGKSISLRDLETVHDLVGRVGGNTLQNLISMLGK